MKPMKTIKNYYEFLGETEEAKELQHSHIRTFYLGEDNKKCDEDAGPDLSNNLKEEPNSMNPKLEGYTNILSFESFNSKK